MATITASGNIAGYQSRSQFRTQSSSSSSLVYQVREDCTATLGATNLVPLKKGDKVRASSPVDLERSRARSRDGALLSPGNGGDEGHDSLRQKRTAKGTAPLEPWDGRIRVGERVLSDTSGSVKREETELDDGTVSQKAENCFVVHLRTGLPVWVGIDKLTYPNGIWVSPDRRKQVRAE